MTWVFPGYTDNEDSKLSWVAGHWLSCSGKIIFFSYPEFKLCISLKYLPELSVHFFKNGISLWRFFFIYFLFYLYSSIHSKFLPLLGPSIYLLSLSGNKIQLPRLLRSKLLIPTQEAPASISWWFYCWFLFHCEHVHFIYLFLLSLFSPHSSDTQIKNLISFNTPIIGYM